MTKPKLAAYFRVSSHGQKSEESINRQFDNFEFQKNGLLKEFDIAFRFEGSGPSTHFIDDPYNLEEWNEATAFYEFIERIKRGEIQAIWVSESDRLLRSRSRVMRATILDVLENNRIRVFTKQGEVSHNTLSMEILSMFGAEDKKLIMKKMHEGKIYRTKSEGRPSGLLPLGLQWNRYEKTWTLVDKEVAMFRCAVGLAIGKEFPEMPDTLKAVVQLNPDGMNDVEVADALNKAGFSKGPFFDRINFGKHIKGSRPPFTRFSVEKMFRHDRDRYTGYLSFRLKTPDQVGNAQFKNMLKRNKTLIQVTVPRMIEDADWERLCATRTARRKWSIRNLKHDYLCKDILICSDCGVPLASRPKYPKKKTDSSAEYAPIFYYTCSRKQKVSGFRCKAGKHHPVAIIDELVWSETKKLILQPELLSKIEESAANEQPKNSAGLKKQLEAIDKKLSELAKEQLKASDLLVRGILHEENYIELRQKNANETKNLKNVQHEIQEELLTIAKLYSQSAAIDLISISKKYSETIDTLTFDERRELVTMLIASVSISQEGQLKLYFRNFNDTQDSQALEI